MTRRPHPETGLYRHGSIPFDAIEAIHVGSTTLANDNGAAETLAMIEDARRSTTISFDPNCRPNLVKTRRAIVDQMNAFAASADIVRMSDVDFEFLYGGERLRGKGEVAYWPAGCSLVVITRGMKGAQAWHHNAGAVEVEAPTIKVVDTIGAGDSFQAALLFALHKQGRLARSRLKDIRADELRCALIFGCKCAALTCMRIGADPPRSDEIVWNE